MEISRLLQLLVALVLTVSFFVPLEVLAATSRHKTTRTTTVKKKTHVAQKRTSKTKTVAHKRTKKKTVAHKRTKRSKAVAHKHTPRYAYPPDIFMWSAPEIAMSPLPKSFTRAAKSSFNSGAAGGRFSPKQLVQTGVFTHQPLYGGIFKRRESVRYIVLHSTETERPADGPRVIRSWSHGMRHPGAQYVVDRDGTIYQTVDPEYATVHVNIFRTQNGVNNDNSVGIEIVRAGKQKYTRDQLDSVTKLVAYMQNHFRVANDHIVGHGQIQPSDRTDPVNFNWSAFDVALSSLKFQAMAMKKRTQSRVFPFGYDQQPNPYDPPRPHDVTGPSSEDEDSEPESDTEDA